MEGLHYWHQAALRRLGLLLEKPVLTLDEQYEVVNLELAVERMQAQLHVSMVAVNHNDGRVVVLLDDEVH